MLKDQCALYWPENIGETLEQSDFKVKLMEENNYGDYFTRELNVVEKEVNTFWTITRAILLLSVAHTFSDSQALCHFVLVLCSIKNE